MHKTLALLASATLLGLSLAAHATPITYNVTGALFSGSGTYSGTAIVDDVTGVFSGGTFSVFFSGTTYSNLLFARDNSAAGNIYAPATVAGRYQNGNSVFIIAAPRAADGGFEGGDACTQACGQNNTEFVVNVTNPLSAGTSGNSGTFSVVGGTVATPAVAATPEPSSLVLLGTGILGLAGAARRRFLKA